MKFKRSVWEGRLKKNNCPPKNRLLPPTRQGAVFFCLHIRRTSNNKRYAIIWRLDVRTVHGGKAQKILRVRASVAQTVFQPELGDGVQKIYATLLPGMIEFNQRCKRQVRSRQRTADPLPSSRTSFADASVAKAVQGAPGVMQQPVSTVTSPWRA